MLANLFENFDSLSEAEQQSIYSQIYNVLLLRLALEGTSQERVECESPAEKSNPLESRPSLADVISFLRDWYDESTNFKSEIESVFREMFSELISTKKAMMIFDEWVFSYNHLRHRPSFLIAARLLYAGAVYRTKTTDSERRKFILTTFPKEEREVFEQLLTLV